MIKAQSGLISWLLGFYVCVYNDLAYTKQNPEVTIYYLPFIFFKACQDSFYFV